MDGRGQRRSGRMSTGARPDELRVSLAPTDRRAAVGSRRARDRPVERAPPARGGRHRGRPGRGRSHRDRPGRGRRHQRRSGRRGARVGIGQLAFGLLAAGQVAAGALGAVGQIATGPHALGMVSDGGWWWRSAGSSPAPVSRPRSPSAGAGSARWSGGQTSTAIAEVRDGHAHVGAEVVSLDNLRAPLSSRACAFWHAVDGGTGGAEHERSGGRGHDRAMARASPAWTFAER